MHLDSKIESDIAENLPRPFGSKGAVIGTFVELVCTFVMVLWVDTCGLAAQVQSSFDVTTYHYDTWRTGWNRQETALSPTTIRKGSFGELRSVPLDEQVDAQPLVVANLEFDGRPRDVVYVATENNTVYAIDASLGSILRTRSLGMPVPADMLGIPRPGVRTGCGNNGPVVGINSTPVIDRDNGLLYVVYFTVENGEPTYRLRALDLSSLADRIASPFGRLISASSILSDGSKLDFIPRVSRQRSALLLANGNVYAAFGSFCDHDQGSTRGWLLGWKADTLVPLSANEVTDRRAHTPQNYFLSSIWMSGYGVAADESGNVYFITGNSDKTAPPVIDQNVNLQESVVKVKGDLSAVLDYFTPSDGAFGMHELDKGDMDFGASGALVIPGDQSGAVRHLAIASGKSGKMYLLDRDDLGKFDPSGINHVLDAVDIGRCWCGQSYFVGPDGIGRVVSSGGDTLTAWQVRTSSSVKLIRDWDAQEKLANLVFQKGFFTSISSNGEAPDTALIWAVQRPAKAAPAPKELTLWAFDAKDGTKLATLPAGGWPNTGGAANTIPVVANGKVYVASNKELKVFGLSAPPVEKATVTGREMGHAPIGAELTPGSNVTIHGDVIGPVEGDGATLWFNTCPHAIKVDVAKAREGQKAPELVPGRSLVVYGSVSANGVITAERIDYGGDLPGQWPGCPQ